MMDLVFCPSPASLASLSPGNPIRSRVWRPQLQPPILPKYWDLSPDAHLVMAAIIQEYRRKKEILKNKLRAKPTEPKNYYKMVYRGSFDADIPQSVLGDTQSVLASQKQARYRELSNINTQNDSTLNPSLYGETVSQQVLFPPTDFHYQDHDSDITLCKRMLNETVKDSHHVDSGYNFVHQRNPHAGGDNFSSLQDSRQMCVNENSFSNTLLYLDVPETIATSNINILTIDNGGQTPERVEQNLSQVSADFSISPAEYLTFADSDRDEASTTCNKIIEKLPELPSLDLDGDLQSAQDKATEHPSVLHCNGEPPIGIDCTELFPFKCDHVSERLAEVNPDIIVEMLPKKTKADQVLVKHSGQCYTAEFLGAQHCYEEPPTGIVCTELSPFKCGNTVSDRIAEENHDKTVGMLTMKRKADQRQVKHSGSLEEEMAIHKSAEIDKAQSIAKISLHNPPKRSLSRHNSVEDTDLDIIEHMLSQGLSSSQKAKKFKTPFKPPSLSPSTTSLILPIKERMIVKPTKTSTAVRTSSAQTTPTNFLSKDKFCFDDETKLRQFNVLNIKYLSPEQRISLRDEVLQSKEVLLTLIHKDGSSLLTSMPDANKKKMQFDDQKKIIGLAIGIENEPDREDPCKVMRSVKDQHNRCIYIPLSGLKRHSDSFNWACQFLENLMVSPVRKVSFQTKDVLLRIMDTFAFCQSVTFSWIILDVQLATWLLDPDNPVQTFDELVQGKTSKPENLGGRAKESPLKQLMSDFGLLASTMRQLFHKLTSRELWPLFINLETRLIPLLTKMERTSIKVDPDLFLKFSDVLKCKLNRLEKKAHQLAGHSFCINSHPQLRQVLFEELRLDQISKNKTKVTTTAVNHAKSTSEAVLTQLTETHPLPAVILEYRQLQKLKSTYVEGLMVCVEKGYLQTHWDQIAAATGRLTSYQPNLQSVPKQPVTITDYKTSYIVGKDTKDESFNIFARDPVVSDEGCSLLSADFQQIELRLLAHLSDDPKLTSIFTTTTNEDIFIKLTSDWLSKPGSSVTEQEREQTKRIVYSVMYGAGKEKLAEYLKIDASHAKAIMISFLEKFPAINIFTKKCKDFCLKYGYTSTIFKRRRLIPHINSKSPKMRSQAERQAVNFCVQGSAADICKAAMLQVEEALNSKPYLQARLLLQIHDELLFEIPDENLEEFSELVRSVMESTDSLCGDMVHLKVPLSVSISVGKRWGHLEKIRQN